MPRMVPKQAPTIEDIARRVGVSHTAVSMALRGAPGVGTARREQILAAAREMNYEPQIAARLLRARQTGQIGLLVCRLQMIPRYAGFYMPLMMEFVHACEQEQRGYHIEFFEREAGQPFRPPRQLVGGLVDGMLSLGYIDEDLREWLSGQDRFPWVSVEEPGRTCVLSASDRGVYEAVQHLAALGHRRIALATSTTRYTVHRLGTAGFRQAAAEFDIACPSPLWQAELELEPREVAHASARAWAKALLASRPRPTAVVVTLHLIAKVLLHEALQCGLRVPGDLSVITYGTVSETQFGAPLLLTTIEPDFHALIGAGTRQLQQLLAGKRTEPELRIPPHLVAGESVAPVRR